MTKEQIGDFAFRIQPQLRMPNKPAVLMTDGETQYGIFENNQIHSEDYENNTWNFTLIPVINNISATTITGNDIADISVI